MAKKKVIYEMEDSYLTKIIDAVCWKFKQRVGEGDTPLEDNVYARNMVAEMLHSLVDKHDKWKAKQAVPENNNEITITVEDV